MEFRIPPKNHQNGRPGLPDRSGLRGIVLSVGRFCNFLVLFIPYFKYFCDSTGLTFQLDEGRNKNGYFLDTPGLADESLRRAAGHAISEGLRKGGTFIVLFFVTQEAGRVNQQDATTMRLVLEAAPCMATN